MIPEQKGGTTGMPDPQIAHILAVVADASREAKPLAETTPAELRAAPDTIAPFGLATEPVAKVDNRTIPGRHGHAIPIRVYRPDGAEPKPILVFFHGGCWVFGSLDTHDALGRYFANRAGCLVVSVDYRLAPEHPFPAGVEDAYDVVAWLRDHAGQLGGDATRIAVGGDSAGGNLAAVVALIARDRGAPAPALQLLIYPITDISDMQTESYRDFAGGFLSRELMEWSAGHYLTDDADRRHPYVSPLLADDLRDLAPAFVLTAELDVLRDEGEAYAARLAAAGNRVRLVRYGGMVHAFIAMAGTVDLGQVALDDCARALRDAFAVPAPGDPR
jgi:acetyl esterase